MIRAFIVTGAASACTWLAASAAWPILMGV
jgi:hypothetical protein